MYLPSEMSRSRISQANIVGFSRLYCSILDTTVGVATLGFEPPMMPDGRPLSVAGPWDAGPVDAEAAASSFDTADVDSEPGAAPVPSGAALEWCWAAAAAAAAKNCWWCPAKS